MYNVEENFGKYKKDIGTNILFAPAPGEIVKEVRKSIEVSQDDLAHLMGLRRETISRIETGAITPTTSFIRRFSKFVSIIKIFRDMNALKDAESQEGQVPLNPTFIRTHFSLSTGELDSLMQMGNASYSKTKKKVLRRIRI
jgi:transcriptional regulator with XRE-family HTH domain